ARDLARGGLPPPLDDGRRVARHARAPRDHVVDRESVHTHLRSPVMRHARHCPTMSAFMGPSAASSSFFSRSPTLYLSRALTSASTVAFHSASVMFMPLCVSFMSRPRYEQGPPSAWQIFTAMF